MEWSGLRQSTIARAVECVGIGLHSGLLSRIRLEPAPADSGIVFVRAGPPGVKERMEIPARIACVHSSSRATTLARDPAAAEWRVETVEHLLASLYAHSIDNLRVELEGSEIPAFDGSAGPLFELVGSAGRVSQAPARRFAVLEEVIEIREGERWICAEPADDLRISYAIEFEHALIGRQAFELPRLDAKSFGSELAAARTFGFEEEVEALRSLGLGLGGSLENTVVLSASGILNEGGLRYADEFVRHKVVDLLGDLALLGAPLKAHIRVERGGHALHHRMVRALADTCWP